MEGYWNADRDDDADFIHTVRTKGEKINEYFFDTGEVDAPFKETHYLYDGVKYRIYDYRFDNSAMELLDKSTKKSKATTKSFNDMVKSQRAKNIRKGLGPEITASMDLLEDIAYLADACSMEAKSIADGIYEKSPSEIGFKCSPEEFKQKLLECKQLADWLVNNLEFWTFM